MAILTHCCNDEDKARILDQARKAADERQRVDVCLAPAEEAIPSTEPDWDPNTRAGKKPLRHLTNCLLQGMTWGVQKVFNYIKIKEVTQGENEHPALFSERLTVQFSSVAQSCPTLCDPMNRSAPGLPDHQLPPEFTQTHVHQAGDAIQPFHPLSSPSPPAPNPSQHQGLFQWVKSSHEVAKVLEFQLQHQSFKWTFRTNLNCCKS